MTNNLYYRRRTMIPVVIAAALLPEQALANQGLKGLGDAVELLAKILFAYTGINLVLSLANLSMQKTWVRVVNVILTFPLVFIAFLFFAWHIAIGAIAIALVALQFYVIHKSRMPDSDRK